MKLLTITYKRCYHVDGKYYTTGGSPKEFNALPERLEFYLLAEFLERDKVEAAWTQIDPRVRCFSLGEIGSIHDSRRQAGPKNRCRTRHRYRLDEGTVRSKHGSPAGTQEIRDSPGLPLLA